MPDIDSTFFTESKAKTIIKLGRLRKVYYFAARTMRQIQIRNRDLLPEFENEARFWKSLPSPKRHDVKHVAHTAHCTLPTHKRLFYHQTLSSARKSTMYQPLVNLIPSDSLDFVLAAIGDGKQRLHASRAEILVQRETCGQQTARRLKNTIDIVPELVPELGHPLKIGKNCMLGSLCYDQRCIFLFFYYYYL